MLLCSPTLLFNWLFGTDAAKNQSMADIKFERWTIEQRLKRFMAPAIHWIGNKNLKSIIFLFLCFGLVSFADILDITQCGPNKINHKESESEMVLYVAKFCEIFGVFHEILFERWHIFRGRGNAEENIQPEAELSEILRILNQKFCNVWYFIPGVPPDTSPNITLLFRE